MVELADLARTAGSEVVGSDVQARRTIDPAHFIGMGKVEELRGAVKRVREHGKRVVVLLEGGGDAEYYLAASADRVRRGSIRGIASR